MKNRTCYTLTLLTFLAFTFSCKEEKKTVKQTEIAFTKEGELSIIKKDTDSVLVKLDIEIADTDYDIQTGLMYRNNMQANQAMLFVFKDESLRNFYMKNTHIPLDLIFIDQNKTIVSFQKNAKPLDETSLPSNQPAQYVLEVNAGKVDYWQVSIGDQLKF